jgi:hypothetical protein
LGILAVAVEADYTISQKTDQMDGLLLPYCCQSVWVIDRGFHRFLHFACKSLQNRSGGTRIRTGDTMIFSHVLYQLSYPAGS